MSETKANGSIFTEEELKVNEDFFLIEKEPKLNSNSNAKFMLSTFDNPYDPFTQYNEWLSFDEEKARKENTISCNCLLARYVESMIDESKLDQFDDKYDEYMDNAIEASIDAIIKGDPLAMYCKKVNNNV
jgi:hypothetical protein